jgi:hypothetical protein
LLAIIIFIVVAFFLVIQLSSVQTYAGHKFADFLSNKLNTKVEIGSIHFAFFKRIEVADVYIEDLHNDTLLYAKKLNVGIKDLDFENNEISLRKVTLLNAKAKLIKYRSDEDFNFQFIIDAFSPKQKKLKTPSDPINFKVGEVAFVNTDFSFKNEHDTLNTRGVNYFDLRVQNINGLITDVEIEKDTIRGTIDYLSAIEKSGFVLNNISSYVSVSPIGIQLDELKITTPESDISTDLTFKYDTYRDFKDFINKVKFKAEFDRSILQMSDIAFFADELKGIDEQIDITGKINGTVADLRGKALDFKIGKATRFKGDVTLTGLPKVDETLIYLSVKSLTTNYSDLTQFPIPPFDKKNTLQIPKNLALLGTVNFKGTFTGLYNDFYAYGDLRTALGELSSDIAVRHDYEKNKEFYKGKLQSKAFDFGKFLSAPALGKATVDVNIDGEGITIDDLKAKLTGTVNSVEFNNYSYKNILIEGDVANQIFNGKLNVKDDNIDFDFIGNVDFTKSLPKLDFIATLNKADLGALHFIKTEEKTNLSTQMFINVTGNTIDNLIGQINFDNTIYIQGDKTYKLSVFNLTSELFGGKKVLKLNSDFADVKLYGNFKILELPVSIEKLLSNYLPSYFNKNYKNVSPQNFEYSILFKKNDAVLRLFAPDLAIAPKTSIRGKYNSISNDFELTGSSSKISYNGIDFKTWNIVAINSNNNLQLNSTCDKLQLTDSLFLGNFMLCTETHEDSVDLSLEWDNKSKEIYKGNIEAFIYFNKNKSLLFKILPSQLTISDSLWVINKANEIRIDSSTIKVNELMFEHNEQYVLMDGTVSKNKDDQLKLRFNQFNLSNLNVVLGSYGINLKGRINGISTMSDAYNDLIFLSDNEFVNLSINDNLLGNGGVESLWDKNKEALYLHGQFTLAEIPNILFSGYYYPKKKEDNIDMELNLQSIQMQLLEPFVKKYCDDFVGVFSGNISVKGAVDKPVLAGKLNVNAKKITVGYLKTSYRFIDEIIIEDGSFGIENATLFDMNNNRAVVTGKVYHNNFKNFQLDFDIQPYKFMCLNTTEMDNNLFYGRAYATGTVNIFGFTDNILIDANVKTEKITSSDKSDKVNLLSKTEITKIFIPLSGTSEVSENNFITFVKKDSVDDKGEYTVNLSGLKLNFDLEVTPDAEIQLIFDQKVGDVIKAKGTGDIKLKISSTGDFQMYGDYDIDNGDYLFTLQNILNKKFDIEKGSTIKWSGVPYKADLNISAIYKARASIKPFFPSDSSSALKKRYPVDLKLYMTEDLLEPHISFDIGLPTVDAAIRQQVLGFINTETEMNRQAFSLLVLNSFVSPPQFNSGTGGAGVDGAIGSNAFELLSNQLSNMLSKISNDFDIGVNYRPGDAINKDELGVALSTQLFDEKLTIDGNVGVNNNNQNTNNIVGDVNVEYKLTDDGKVRVKAFNKANDNNSTIITSGPYTQGVGIFYREEFNTIGELYRRYLDAVSNRRNKEKKTEEIPPTEILE